MLNPWLTLPFHAVRLGLETQSVVADQMMRLAGMAISDRKAAGKFIPDPTPLPTTESSEAPASSVEASAPAKSANPRQLAEKVKNVQKKRGLGKRRRSK